MTSPQALPEDLFQHMLESLDAGADRQAVVARLAAAPAELRTLVEMAQQLRAAASPPPDPGPALARARQRLLASLPAPLPAPEPAPARAPRPASARPRPAAPSWWEWLQGALRLPPAPAWATVAAILLLVLGLTAFTTVRVSAAALPGQPLYGVKRAAENVTLFLTRDPKAREQLVESLEDRRRDEVNTLLGRGLEEEIEVTGELIAREGSGWRVGEWLVVGSQEAFAGLPAGAVVRISGMTTIDGRIRADSVWIVSLPTPSPTPVPTATPTPRPRPTRQPAPNIQPTPRPPTRSPRPTRTPGPTATTQPSPTPAPATLVLVGVFRQHSGGLITIDDQVFRLAPALDVSDLKIGSQVRVYYRLLAGGDKLALAIDLLATATTTPLPAPITINGEITGLDGGRIVVGGYSFRLTAQTSIDGDPAVGKQATVSGHYDADGDLIADAITVREWPSIDFSGVITSIQGGRLTIDGPYGVWIVDIGGAVVTGAPVVGATVEGHGRQRPDGLIIAESLIVVSSPATPTSPPTATPSATPPPADTPTPTEPVPTDTPVPPTDTPIPPTDTPIPPTDTPIPPTEPPPPTTEPTQEAG